MGHDICLLSQRYSNTEAELMKLQGEAEWVGLKINVAKTKEARINSNVGHSWRPWNRAGSTLAVYRQHCNRGGCKENRRSVWKTNYVRSGEVTTSHAKHSVAPWCACHLQSRRGLETFIDKYLRGIMNIRWPEWYQNSEAAYYGAHLFTSALRSSGNYGN